jgi:hypothetical protein
MSFSNLHALSLFGGIDLGFWSIFLFKILGSIFSAAKLDELI